MKPTPHTLQPPTILDVFSARRRIAPHLPTTPLYRYQSLCDHLGLEIFVKHENHQPIGAFKVRGGVNLVSRLEPVDRKAGVISASTGNHGQSIAFAGQLFDVPVTIVVPEGANPGKVESMRALGAEIIVKGRDFDDSREHVEFLASERGCRYVHSANEPLLISGVGTYALEILEDLPDLDVLLVPIGGGSGACGCGLVLDSLATSVELIGVGAQGAPAAYLSWKERRFVEAPMDTFAEGLATRSAFELTQLMLQRYLDDYVLVSDDELKQAICVYLEKTRDLVEGAGAAALAAATKIADRLRGKKVAVVLSGGNLSMPQLRDIISPTDS